MRVNRRNGEEEIEKKKKKESWKVNREGKSKFIISSPVFFENDTFIQMHKNEATSEGTNRLVFIENKRERKRSNVCELLRGPTSRAVIVVIYITELCKSRVLNDSGSRARQFYREA